MALNNRNWFSHSSGDWEPEINMPTLLVSGESSLSGLWAAAISLSVRLTSSLCSSGREEGSEGRRELLFDVSPYRDTNPVGSGPHPYDLI